MYSNSLLHLHAVRAVCAVQAEAAERSRAEVRVLKEQLATARAQQEATAASMQGEQGEGSRGALMMRMVEHYHGSTWLAAAVAPKPVGTILPGSAVPAAILIIRKNPADIALSCVKAAVAGILFVF